MVPLRPVVTGVFAYFVLSSGSSCVDNGIALQVSAFLVFLGVGTGRVDVFRDFLFVRESVFF